MGDPPHAGGYMKAPGLADGDRLLLFVICHLSFVILHLSFPYALSLRYRVQIRRLTRRGKRLRLLSGSPANLG